jgi:hypothetical protein
MMGLESGAIENTLLINEEIMGKNQIRGFGNKTVNKLMAFHFTT